MNLDQLIRDADPARGLDIRTPDPPAIAKKRRSGQIGGIVVLGAAVALVVVVTVGALAFLRPANPNTGTSLRASGAQPLLRILGVLRRPQRGPRGSYQLVRAKLRRFERRPLELGTADTALLRLATTAPWGQKLFLVPIKPLTAAQRASLVARLPPRARRIAASQFQRQGDAYRLAILTPTRDGGGTLCASAAAISSHGCGYWSGSSLHPLVRGWVVMVVPDGVAKVTLLLPPGDTSIQGQRTVTALVHNNVLAVNFEGPFSPTGPFHHMIWYGPTGSVVRRFGNINP